MSITPPYLELGDKIAIVASARKIDAAALQAPLEEIRKWGLEPVLGPNIHTQDRQFAGTDKQRAADIQWAMDDPSIKAILFARGGYGTVRLLDLLDFSRFKEVPKWIAGYSDITILHGHLQTQFGMESLHSTMPISFPENSDEAKDSLRNALFGKLDRYEVEAKCLSEGEAEGILVGGNLSLLYCALGTPEQPDTNGAILFLEDLDEHLYHVDRMAQALKRAGVFDGINGLVLGGLTDMRDKTTAHGFKDDDPFGRTAEEIILEALGRTDIPICSEFPAGHLDDNRCLILGRKTKMAVGKTTILSF